MNNTKSNYCLSKNVQALMIAMIKNSYRDNFCHNTKSGNKINTLPRSIQKTLVRQGVVNVLSDSISTNAILLIRQIERTITKREYLKTIIQNIRLIFLNMTVLAMLPAHAKDFGTKGHTYQIIEQPFLEMIDKRLQKVDMNKEQEKMTTIVQDRINNPQAVEGIKPAIKNRIFYFDPTYTLAEDAVLPCGKILHKAGVRVNPLEHMSLNRRLFFIDNREAKQISWLKKRLTNPLPAAQEPIEDRIILIGGSVFKLKEELGIEHENKVYFDQHGELTAKFGIKASPAIVVQDELRLKIEEIKL